MAASGQAKLVHAFLDVHEPSKDSLDMPGPSISRVDFQFNPKELTMTKSAGWEHDRHANAQSAGTPHFTGSEPGSMTLEMFFDASEKQDSTVKDRVDALFACCVPTPDSLVQSNGSPPWVVFRWGELTSFTAYIQSVQARYTLFTSAGMPIRAVCTVTLQEISGTPGKTNPTSGGLLPRRVHTMREGDSLPALAYREYGSAALWRALATVNGVDDPARIPTGTAIYLPTQTELKRPPQLEGARQEVSRAHR